MCLVALSLDESRRFPLVIASNRDEFFQRPAARLAWWSHAPSGPALLAGRDLEGGGTWLGLTAAGRLGLVTNVRAPAVPDPAAPSRGRIVPEWLGAREPVDRFWMRTALSGYAGFNLIAADFSLGECWWASNAGAHPVRLERGLYGLSNAGLDTPWPKVVALKQRVRDAMARAAGSDELATLLFAALADRTLPTDDALPDTGIGLDKERMLAPAFIRPTAHGYGTRCSTLVITEKLARHKVTHVFERTFSPNGGLALLRRATLNHWPPRWLPGEPVEPVQSEAIRESEDSAAEPSTPDAGLATSRRSRVRSLLRPAPRRKRPATTATE